MSKLETEKLREEFAQYLRDNWENRETLPVADYWINKMKEQRKKMIKKTTGILRQIGTVENDEDMEKVINIIKNLDD